MQKQFAVTVWLSALVCVCLQGKAQLPDSVAMTVGGKPVPLSEFVYIAHKNNGVDLSDEKSLKEYVELFKNFKLKITDAERRGLDTTAAFYDEFNGYKAQLIAGYLCDRQGEEAAARVVYDRGGEYAAVSHILIPFPSKRCVTQDTIAPYQRAMDIYKRIQSGEDFDTLGIALYKAQKGAVQYATIPCFLPLQQWKVFEDAVYSASVGQPTLPVRSAEGFHLIKVHFRRPTFGKIQAAYINIPCTMGSVTRSKEAVARLAAEAYDKAMGGEDFSSLVETYSADTLHKGVLPPFFPGDFVTPIEDAVCALEKPGDITPPVITETGAYLFKLIEKKGREAFNDAKAAIIDNMRKTEWNFVLYQTFDDYLKKEYKYVFHPEAYAELENLCDNYFPDSNDFPAHAKNMNKTLIELNGEAFPQKEFVYYIRKNPFSAKTYSKDFLKEVFALFVRDIATMFERRNLETKYPDMPHLIQEYRDGILLFELSNIMVWSHPLEEQDGLERQWLKELNDKYPVTINWTALKQLTRKQ